ncbi:MAG: DUF4145 domain-containing protein [Chloroflexi bacterium]|nr:DUF4145 domain-containing protein [Chloroflexota bacterium]
MKEFSKNALAVARRLHAAIPRSGKKSSKPDSEGLIDSTLVEGTRLAFLTIVIDQINGPFEHEWYDASAVMLRRLIETLIIEAYVQNGIESKVKDSNGDFFLLADLVVHARNEPVFNLSRNTKKLLTQLKKLGDLSAHNRRFNAKRKYMDNLAGNFYLDIQTLVKEFVDLAQ